MSSVQNYSSAVKQLIEAFLIHSFKNLNFKNVSHLKSRIFFLWLTLTRLSTLQKLGFGDFDLARGFERTSLQTAATAPEIIFLMHEYWLKSWLPNMKTE